MEKRNSRSVLETILKGIKDKSKIGIMLTAGILNGLVTKVNASTGILDIENRIYPTSEYVSCIYKIIHRPGASEGIVNYPGNREDCLYGNVLFNPPGINSKIVSIVDSNELKIDARPEDSQSPVYLELSIHSRDGSIVDINTPNEVIFNLPFANLGYDFGNKPITYWERDFNEPNIYYLTSNVRKEILQNNGSVSLLDIENPIGSEVQYLNALIRFDMPYVHLNDDSIVNLKDYAIWAKNYGRTGITNTERSNPTDIGAWTDYDLDGDVDITDLGIFSDYYLTSRKRHLEDGWILE